MFRLLNKQLLPANNTKMLILCKNRDIAEEVRYVGLDYDDDEQEYIVLQQDDYGEWYIPQDDWNIYAWIQIKELCKEVFGALE